MSTLGQITVIRSPSQGTYASDALHCSQGFVCPRVQHDGCLCLLVIYCAHARCDKDYRKRLSDGFVWRNDGMLLTIDADAPQSQFFARASATVSYAIYRLCAGTYIYRGERVQRAVVFSRFICNPIVCTTTNISLTAHL